MFKWTEEVAHEFWNKYRIHQLIYLMHLTIEKMSCKSKWKKYASNGNITISINDFTKSSISFNIEDTNELSYTYTNNYKIYKKVKNENYTGIGDKIGEDTENSTAGFTGTGTEYIWEEVEKCR